MFAQMFSLIFAAIGVGLMLIGAMPLGIIMLIFHTLITSEHQQKLYRQMPQWILIQPFYLISEAICTISRRNGSR